jgi:acetylornithine/succinyldiaminopimelate/putrescine aminotransferase
VHVWRPPSGSRYDAWLARLDLRRQPAGGSRGERGAGRDAEARFLRACAEDVALLKQKLASVVDRHPKVLAEVRGEGLLIGLKAVPSGDLVAALREQKLLTVGAGENVVRFLPPLIVTEAEIEESVARLERACTALSGDQQKRAAGQ